VPNVGARLRCEIFPSDLDRTLRFYVDVLAFDVVRDNRHADAPYLEVHRGEVRLGAAPRPPIADAEARRPPIGVELTLEVDDLDAEHARISTTGWPISEGLVRRPWGLRDFRLLDPDGYYWCITEADPPQDQT
jgi:catechol 2,3-dioxygenase-like lactoylglutathione lyase family enzyme